MNETQRMRVLLLALAGSLLIGGTMFWRNAQQAKQAEEPVIKHQFKKKKKAKKARLADGKDAGNLKGTQDAKVADTGINAAAKPDQVKAGIEISKTTKGKNIELNTQTLITQTNEAQPKAPAATPNEIVATNRPDAEKVARVDAGRNDPFQSVTGYKPFPRPLAHVQESEPEIKPKGGKHKLLLVPPPPPIVSNYTPPIPEGELPEPPSRPSIAHKFKLVAVIEDKAILRVTDKGLAKDNKWPQTLTLGPGERFESVSVLEVQPHSITIEEDGERSVKTLERVR